MIFRIYFFKAGQFWAVSRKLDLIRYWYLIIRYWYLIIRCHKVLVPYGIRYWFLMVCNIIRYW